MGASRFCVEREKDRSSAPVQVGASSIQAVSVGVMCM